MIRLSAVGMSELRPIRESDLKPFVLPDDDEPVAAVTTTPPRPVAGQSLVSSLDRLAKIQCEFTACLMELMRAVVESSVDGPSALLRSMPVTAAARAYPAELLNAPWDSLMVSDERLGFPPGCVRVLTEANVVSLDALADYIASDGLTRLPKVGKAKAAVITETHRAFVRAVEAARKDEAT